MAQQAGAALWHMYGFFGWFAFRTPGFEAPFALDFFAAGHLFVDADGRRFADETGYEVHDRLRALLTYLPRNPNRPRLPTWAVFDEATRLAGPLNGLLGTPNDYVWSADNSAEVERGWIVARRRPGRAGRRDRRRPGRARRARWASTTPLPGPGRDDEFGRDRRTRSSRSTSPASTRSRPGRASPARPAARGTTRGPGAAAGRPAGARPVRGRRGEPGLRAPDRPRRRPHRRDGVRPDRRGRGRCGAESTPAARTPDVRTQWAARRVVTGRQPAG